MLGQVLAIHAAHAQTTPTVTEADIERAKRSQPSITEQDVQRARERNRMPTDAELRRVPVPSTPNIDALPKPATQAPVDLEALAHGFDAQTGQAALSPKAGPVLLVFISFAMPEATLSRLVDQAARTQASLVLRGLVDGSLVHTVSRVQQLIGTRKVAVQIDPQAFDRYAITQTPSFVLVRDGTQPQPCAGGLCVPGNGFVTASGDVSLDYALSFFQRSAPGFARDASGFLKRLKG
ncbi:type-F conjugative transfer system pilin assembly protein TrbC [Methylibium sp.]|uniref:type-F conjugative transfer system pilin assembly protein TrbC n=1 Tax=Methylibium sp. TaxID=2067992 RepID=UPI003D118F32